MLWFRGATSFEFQVGRLWLTILRPKFWLRGNLRRFIRLGIEED